MKMVNLKLDDEMQKELEEKMFKQRRKKKIRLITTSVLMIVFAIVVTLTFIKVGDRFNIEFIMGQLCIFVIFTVTTLVNAYFQNLNHDELEQILDEVGVEKLIEEQIEKINREEVN